MATITWTMHRGHRASKPWVAQIKGTDEQYTFARDFQTPSYIRFAASGKTGDYEFSLTDGLYEDSDGDFTLVFTTQAGETKHGAVDKDRAYRIAKILDLGLSLTVARLATLSEASITDANRDAVTAARAQFVARQEGVNA